MFTSQSKFKLFKNYYRHKSIYIANFVYLQWSISTNELYLKYAQMHIHMFKYKCVFTFSYLNL